MSKFRYAVILIAFVILLPSALHAADELSLPRRYQDGAVLQCELPLMITGRGIRGSTVTLHLANERAEVVVDAKGAWSCELPAQPPGGPYDLRVADDRGGEVVSSDVYLGEVWLCAGQSNMVFDFTRMHKAEAFTAAAGSSVPRLRLLRRDGWQVADGDERLQTWAITPFYFGRALERDLDRAVGLMTLGIGGTSAFLYSNPDDLQANPDTAGILQLYRERQEGRVNKQPGPGLQFSGEPRWPWNRKHSPGQCWDWITGVSGVTVRGVIWWQGENDVALNRHYEPVFRQLIRSWRQVHVRGDDLPFIFVQLPTYQARPAQSWPEATGRYRAGMPGLRDAQRRVLSEPNTAMVVSLDLYGSGGIHPSNKVDYGERLAQTARAVVYGESLVWSGPLLADHAVDGSSLVLGFSHVGDGLAIRDGVGRLLGFQIAGEDRVFVDAHATIEAPDRVRVQAEGVTAPVAVRYAWHENPPHSLVGSTGLPASPFATDDWPVAEGHANQPGGE